MYNSDVNTCLGIGRGKNDDAISDFVVASRRGCLTLLNARDGEVLPNENFPPLTIILITIIFFSLT